MKHHIIIFSFISLLVPVFVIAQQNVGVSDIGYLTSLPPDPPFLISPMDQVTTSIPATLNWQSKIHTSDYALEVSNSSDFSELLVNETLTDTVFTLTNLASSVTYFWRVLGKNVAGDGNYSEVRQFTVSSISVADKKPGTLPTRYALLSVYPNPFNPSTTITYHLPEKADVSLVIYNGLGQAIRELASGLRPAGKYTVTWDARDRSGASLLSGLYLFRFKAGSRVFTQKTLLIR